MGRNPDPTFAEVQGVQSIIAKLLQKVAKNFVQTVLLVSWYEYSVYQELYPKKKSNLAAWMTNTTFVSHRLKIQTERLVVRKSVVSFFLAAWLIHSDDK